ncbi:MAG: hypothetical protein COA45_01605 [Zetaproteobacteria bacterium]|nr:MAG: hypothetical protein COA45_01605 [Zetaproteobacteria bacterium]
MSFLDQLSVDQRTLLVSLPYRVGLFVSQSDNTGGDHSDAAEMEALTNIITGYSQEVFGAETVQYVISETVSRRDEWGKWSDDLEAIEGECYKAIDILSDHVDVKEVSAFKNHLIEIGESVALAFREYGKETPLMDKIRVFLFYMKGKRHAAKFGLPYKDWEQFINISLDERKALHRIASALNTTYI